MKAREALLAEDLGDPGAVERGGGVLEGLGDLVDGQALAAELDDLRAGGLLGRGGPGSGAGDDEEIAVPGAEVAEQGSEGVGGVAKAGGGLLQGETFDVIGAKGLVATLVGVARPKEEVGAEAFRGGIHCLLA